MDKYAIVAIAYNREKSLLRLLHSLNQAFYDGEQIPLIISIDYSENAEVQKAAEKFEWAHGEKKIRLFQEKQGLRAHVLRCGEYLQQFDAIAVFEDDLIAAPGFYCYMKEMVSFYKQDKRIAGISLYSHRWNPITDRIFEPLRSNEDVFYMQYAQSWGQIWMKEQWAAFCEWYNRFDDAARQKLLCAASIPQAVACWPESSWLKYHIAYCIYENKYFVYPYDSLTTNCSEAGEHSKAATWRYQVSMQMAKKKYQMSALDDGSIRYDAFFENQNAAQYVGVGEEELCVDLYGSKPGNMGKKYWLTSQKWDKAEKKDTFGLVLRPLEANIIWHTEGDDFTLYEVKGEKVPIQRIKKGMREWDYDIRGEGMSLKNVVPWILYKLHKVWKCTKGVGSQ